jgi:hypothetical protein
MTSLPYVEVAVVLIVVYLAWKIMFPNIARFPPKLRIVRAKNDDCFPFWQATWRNSLNISDTVLTAYKTHGEEVSILPVAGPGGQTFKAAKQQVLKMVSQSTNISS